MRMRWAGHIANGENRNAYRILVETREEGDYEEDQDVRGRTILKRILERSDGMVWIGLICLSIGTGGRLL
jgi:hypothetical protein